MTSAMNIVCAERSLSPAHRGSLPRRRAMQLDRAGWWAAAIMAVAPTMPCLAGDSTIVGPGESIQAAINAGYATVFVLPGVYSEHLVFDLLGNPLHLRSMAGPECTILDGAGLGGSTITAWSGDWILEGFTLRNGGGPDVLGGAVRFNFPYQPASIVNCVFLNNTARGGGAVYGSWFTNMTLDHCRFVGNHAVAGGAMTVFYGQIHAMACQFEGNVATGGSFEEEPGYGLAGPAGGGAVHLHGPQYGPMHSFLNCAFLNNMAPAGFGGAISAGYEAGEQFTVAQCVFRDNGSPGGEAIQMFGCDVLVGACSFDGDGGAEGRSVAGNIAGSTLSGFDNCIMWGPGNGPRLDVELHQPSLVTVRHCDIRGCGGSGLNWMLSGIIDGGGNLDSDPLFADPDLHLTSGSPCIDAGDAALLPVDLTLDYGGNPRVTDGNGDGTALLDIGAYEGPYGTQPGGSIVAWGVNHLGQLNIPSPNADFVSVAAGLGHSLGIKGDGSIVAWGWNDYGQLNVPSPNEGFVAVAGGNSHTLGLKSDGSIVAWGSNFYGESNVPSANSGFLGVSCGAYFSLGLRSDGSILAWGNNDRGQCNVPSPNAEFVAVAAGESHGLGLKSDGSLVAWGNNDSGQCNIPSPNRGFVAVDGGFLHTVGLKTDGSIVAWGANDFGQCNVPAPNAGFVSTAAGCLHSLGLKSDGSIVGWGSIGDPPGPNTGFVAIAAGASHSLGVKAPAEPPGECPGFVARPLPALNQLAIGDVDGDGDNDVVSLPGSTMSVALNMGDGTFGTPVDYPASEYPVSVALGDLDGDGDLDAVVANFFGDDISVYLNAGDGTYLPSTNYPLGSGGTFGSVPYHVIVADVDDDNDLDVVTANSLSTEVSVLTNSGQGAFVNTQNIQLPGEAIFVVAGHIDHPSWQGFPDLAVSTALEGQVYWLKNNGSGMFHVESSIDVGFPQAQSLALADLDWDADLDLVVPIAGSDQIAVLLFNDSSNSFEPAQFHPASGGPAGVTIGDIDGDGNPDVAATGSGSIAVLRNDGHGAFAPAIYFDLGYWSSPLLSGDMNGDCAIDLVGSGAVFENLCPPWDWDGDGLPDACDPCPYEPEYCADLNGDYVVDGGDLGIMIAAWGPCAACATDLNGDGAVDGADMGLMLCHWGYAGPTPPQ